MGERLSLSTARQAILHSSGAQTGLTLAMTNRLNTVRHNSRCGFCQPKVLPRYQDVQRMQSDTA